MSKNMEEYYNTTLVSGIVCKKCGIELPQMLMSEHLDINNPKNKMCGCNYKKISERDDYEEHSDDEIQPHCQICFNMNSNLFVTKNALKPVCSGKCVAKLIEKQKKT